MLNRSKAIEKTKRLLDEGKIAPDMVMRATYLAQKYLNQSRLISLLEDGVLGPLTDEAALAEIGHVTVLPKGQMVWPMPRLVDGRVPRITSGFRHKDRPKHSGADLFYQYLSGQDKPMPIGDGGRDKNWFVPKSGHGSAAIAVANGTVVLTGVRPTGHRVWLDIGGDVFVGYFHLADSPSAGTKMVKGQYVGTISHNPIDTDPNHLHFEVHYGDLDNYPAGLVDPEEFLNGVPVAT